MSELPWWNNVNRTHSLVLYVDGKPEHEVKWKSRPSERDDAEQFKRECLTPALSAIAEKIVWHGFDSSKCAVRYFVEEPVEQVGVSDMWPLVLEMAGAYRKRESGA